jgi:hypothetical protein
MSTALRKRLVPDFPTYLVISPVPMPDERNGGSSVLSTASRSAVKVSSLYPAPGLLDAKAASTVSDDAMVGRQRCSSLLFPWIAIQRPSFDRRGVFPSDFDQTHGTLLVAANVNPRGSGLVRPEALSVRPLRR